MGILEIRVDGGGRERVGWLGGRGSFMGGDWERRKVVCGMLLECCSQGRNGGAGALS